MKSLIPCEVFCAREDRSLALAVSGVFRNALAHALSRMPEGGVLFLFLEAENWYPLKSSARSLSLLPSGSIFSLGELSEYSRSLCKAWPVEIAVLR